MALKRLFANERLFARDPDYAKKYDNVVQDYIRFGHAELLTGEEAKIQKPTFGVNNGKKGTNRLRWSSGM